jgi:hypothetical protein
MCASNLWQLKCPLLRSLSCNWNGLATVSIDTRESTLDSCLLVMSAVQLLLPDAAGGHLPSGNCC